MSTVLLFGTFDILHPGHRDLFRQARQHGDRVEVILARDATVEQVKGRPPHFDEIQRKLQLEREPSIDIVHLGSLTDKYAAIREIKPDVILLGYDQDAFVDKLPPKLQEWGMDTEIIRAKPFHPEKHKSSLLRARLTRDIMEGSH